MDLNEIKELIRIIDESTLTELKLEKEDFKIVLKKESEKVIVRESTPPQLVVQTEQSPLKAAHHNGYPTINSPIVGTFYASSTPGGEPFVQDGSKVSKGYTLCIIEAMKLMNEIEAEEDLKIIKVLVQDGQMVEFGQPLFEIERG